MRTCSLLNGINGTQQEFLTASCNYQESAECDVAPGEAKVFVSLVPIDNFQLLPLKVLLSSPA